MKATFLALFGVALLGAAYAQVDTVVVEPRVFNDIPGSNFTSTLTANSITLSDQNVASSTGWANRHIWWLSENGTTAKEFGSADDLFEVEWDLRLSADPTSPNKEAGFMIRSLSGDMQYILISNGEVVTFGGGVEFYSFTVQNGISWLNDQTYNMKLRYFKNAAGSYRMQLTVNGTMSRELIFDNLEGFLPPPFRIGGYLQVPRTNVGPNGASATWSNIKYNGMAIMPMAPGIPGDTDNSGCVDDADLTNMILDFGGAGGSGGGAPGTDVNNDGIVDDADLTELILSFGTGC